MMRTWTDDWGNEYSAPYIPNLIVGFSGIDPSPIQKLTDQPLGSTSNDEIDMRIENYMTQVAIIDCGEITNN